MVKPTSKNIFLTEEGLLELKREFDALVNKKRPEINSRLQRSRQFGDIIDNNEFMAVRDEQVLVETRIAEIEQILKKAQVVPKPKAEKPDFIIIGSTVVVEHDGEIDEFMIVSTHEANPAKKKISNEAPVGQALLNARVGEVVEVTTPIVRAKYKVLEIK